MKYSIIIIFGIFAFFGYSNANETKKELDKVEIFNDTDFDISNAMIYSYHTKRKMQCSSIPKGENCSYSFNRSKNSKNSFELQWQYKNKVYKQKNVSIKKMNLKKKDVIHIRVNLQKDGRFIMYEI